ncbi:MAG: putative ATPase/DNA-binding winged helix-turn-helix (wHTH) protein [Myxococcota bacterium]
MAGILALTDRSVDLPRRLVCYPDGHSERLTTKEAALLAYLAERSGQDVDRDALLIDVWEYRAAYATRAVDVAMRRLRKKIEPDPREPIHLISVHGVGYRFVPPDAYTAPVPVAAAPSPPELAADPELPAPRLPTEPEGFVGRQAEQAQLRELLTSDQRLVALLGPGGVGKTRLALRVATSLGDAFVAVVWADCSEATDIEGVHGALALALAAPLPDGGDVAAAERRLGRVLAARGRALVVLDNLEQIAVPAAAALRTWLDAAPAVRWMVTSRSRLRVTGEQVVEIAPLPPEDGRSLFIARAAASGARQLTPDDSAIDDVVARLDGLPLAIELAASRARVLSPSQLAQRLNARFALLSGGLGRTARHVTLRATIDWSWELLDAHEQRTLAWCSVFVGGFTLEAAEAVLGTDDPDAPWVLDLLEQLRDKSLLRVEELADVPGELRFTLLVSIREYSTERLDRSGDREAASAAHAEWVLSEADRWRREMDGPGGVEAFQRLAAETDNLLAVAARRPPDQVRSAVLAVALVLQRRGPYNRLITLVDKALGLPGGSPETLAALLVVRCSAWRLRGKLDIAQDDAAHALKLVRETGSRIEAEALASLALIRADQSQFDLAAVLMGQAEQVARENGHDGVYPNLLRAQGAIWMLRGNREDAESVLLKARDIYRERGVPHLLAMAESSLGNLMLDAGRLHEAERHIDAAHRTWRAMGNRRRLAVILTTKGTLAALRGDHAEGEALFRESIALNEQMGFLRMVYSAQANLGTILVARGAFEEGIETLAHSAEGYRSLGDNANCGATRAYVAAALALSGDLPAAERALVAAEESLIGVQAPQATGLLGAVPGFLDLARARVAEGDERAALLARASARARDATTDRYMAVTFIGRVLQDALDREPA